MWLTDYGRHASKTEGNENSHELEEITNFMDVSNRKALHDVFDVSSCLKSDHVTYYALLAAKETTKKEPKSDSSSDLLYSNYTVCMSTYEQRDAPMCCESIREDKSVIFTRHFVDQSFFNFSSGIMSSSYKNYCSFNISALAEIL